jgi:hypothetical protein
MQIKPSQKHQNLTSIGSRFRSPFFLCLIQNAKAVAMGVVAAIAFFWPNGPNPAMKVGLAHTNQRPGFSFKAVVGASGRGAHSCWSKFRIPNPKYILRYGNPPDSRCPRGIAKPSQKFACGKIFLRGREIRLCLFCWDWPLTTPISPPLNLRPALGRQIRPGRSKARRAGRSPPSHLNFAFPRA